MFHQVLGILIDYFIFDFQEQKMNILILKLKKQKVNITQVMKILTSVPVSRMNLQQMLNLKIKIQLRAIIYCVVNHILSMLLLYDLILHQIVILYLILVKCFHFYQIIHLIVVTVIIYLSKSICHQMHSQTVLIVRKIAIIIKVKKYFK